MEREIKRENYLQKLIDAKGDGLIKVVTGLRKVGKSYLLGTIFRRYLLACNIPQENIIEMNLSFDEFAQYKDKKVLRAYLDAHTQGKGPYYLILDEIQEMAGFAPFLLSLQTKSNIDIYVTGSNSLLLSKDIETEFRGSGEGIMLYPASFKEFSEVSDLPEDKALQRYLDYGGMPLAVFMSKAEQREAYLSTLFETTYLKDIEERNGIENKVVFEKLADILSSDIGSLTNAANLENAFRSAHLPIPNDTIAKYIGYLTDSFLFEECKRYDIKGKQYISTPVKYYCGDLGLRNARLHYRDQEYQYLIENAVYLELKRRGYSVDVGVVPVQEKDDNGKHIVKKYEIDFIANRGNERSYIQVALSLEGEGKYDQEARPFRKTKDAFRKIMVVRDQHGSPRYNEEGCLIVSLADFLLDESILASF